MLARTVFSILLVGALVAAAPCLAQGPRAVEKDNAKGFLHRCDPEGTWFGHNSEGLEFIFTITEVSFGRYMAVADGVNVNPYCESESAWRGELKRTGRNTYEYRQIQYCEPKPGSPFPPDVPIVWALKGTLEMTSCDSFYALVEAWDGGIYSWLSQKTPFIDPPDIPIDHDIELWYERMPMP
jgi:hypothetical protein